MFFKLQKWMTCGCFTSHKTEKKKKEKLALLRRLQYP